MSPELVSNLIVGAFSLIAGGGVWQYWIARRRAPIDQQAADLATADTTVGMTIAFAQELNKNYARLSTELEAARVETKDLAARFRVLEEALRNKEQANAQLSGIVQDFNLSWDDLEGRWDVHKLGIQAPKRPPRHRVETG